MLALRGLLIGIVAAIVVVLPSFGMNSTLLRVVLSGGCAASFIKAAPCPSVFYDFTTGQTNIAISVARNSVGYIDDLAGNWNQVAANTLRRSNKGALIEEARTNSIRNNSMQGAVAGLLSGSGALPTNWIISYGTTGLGNANVTVGAPTTLFGVDVLPLTINGTASGTSVIALIIENTAAASNGQSWAGSIFDAVTGSFARTATIEIDELDSGGGFLAGASQTAWTPGATLARNGNFVRTNSNASTAKERLQYRINVTNGDVVNATFYIGWPQLEQGAFATSPIRTTNAAAGRAADSVSFASLPSFGSAFTVFHQMNGLRTSGGATVYFLSESVNNRLLYNASTNNSLRVFNGSAVLSNTTTDLTTGRMKMASAFDGNGRSLTVNGTTVATDANLNPSPAGLGIGNSGSGGSVSGVQYVERIALWPNTRLPNAQLQALTQLPYLLNRDLPGRPANDNRPAFLNEAA